MKTLSSSSKILGIFWFMCSVFTCNTNDVLGKYLGQNLPSIEITFLRFALSALALLPFIAYKGASTLRTKHFTMHAIRGIFIAVAIAVWFKGLGSVPITTATTLSFSIPLFTLPMAFFFLKEQVTWRRWFATIIGFLGVLIAIEPSQLVAGSSSLYLLFSVFLFSVLDIINKRFVCQESMLSMLFYPAVVAALVTMIPVVNVWVMPNFFEFGLLFLLSCGSNLILFFILKAFSIVEASFVSPFRYTEILVSAMFGYLFFNELPKQSTMIGCIVIIISTLYVTYSELKASKASSSKNHSVAETIPSSQNQ